jgi:hypothetical protein
MMSALLGNRFLNLALRLLLGGVFVYAAWSKVLHPQQFAIAVRAYEIVPVPVSNLFALCLSWSELIAGSLIILGIFPRQAAGAILLMLSMFTIALATVLIRGMVIDCGCFESGEHASSPVSPFLIVRNLLLIFAAWIVIQYHDGFLTVFPKPRRRAYA